MSSDLKFVPAQLPPNAQEIRQGVRDHLEQLRRDGVWSHGPGGWARHNVEFSRAIGRLGWIGMTWPKPYGGQGKSSIERYLVTEELLAAGAPMRAHWAADRQVGPLILQYGTEAQRQRFLPLIATGGCAIALGLSEPDAGSDLYAIRTMAKKVEGGWKLNGRKLWSSQAHLARYLSTLVRTAPRTERRNEGFTRLLIDLSLPGVTLRPVIDITQEHSFNEVTFDDVMIADDMVIGEVGNAWAQLTGSELTHERASPDRWTNQYDMLRLLVDKLGPTPSEHQAIATGRLVANLWTLHHMSLSIAGALQQGGNPSLEAAVVKDLGTTYEQSIPEVARGLVCESAMAAFAAGDEFEQVLAYSLTSAPSLSIKGGTREVLRNTIARALGLRQESK